MTRWTLTERRVLELVTLAALVGQSATYETLRASLGVSKRTLQRAVKRLQAAGLIKPHSRSRGSRWTARELRPAKRSASLGTGPAR